MRGQLSLDFIIALIIILSSSILLSKFIDSINIDAWSCHVFSNRISQMGSVLNTFSARAFENDSLNLTYLRWKTLETIEESYNISYAPGSSISAYTKKCGMYYPVYNLSITIYPSGVIVEVKK